MNKGRLFISWGILYFLAAPERRQVALSHFFNDQYLDVATGLFSTHNKYIEIRKREGEYIGLFHERHCMNETFLKTLSATLRQETHYPRMVPSDSWYTWVPPDYTF